MMSHTNQLLTNDVSASATTHELLKHVQLLGLSTVEEYVDWCGQNGFSRRTEKHWRLRSKEREFATRQITVEKLVRKKREIRKPAKLIESIFEKKWDREFPDNTVLRDINKVVFSGSEESQTIRMFRDLLLHVIDVSDLFSENHVFNNLGRNSDNTYLFGLLSLCRQSSRWIRPLKDWNPKTHNLHRQFASLARHLYAKWSVPAFMDSVWFQSENQHASQQQEWFLHIGGGQNIRTADIPLPLTKKMAHEFSNAPDDCSTSMAMRWGQVRGLGGSPQLANSIVGTNLGKDFSNEKFWFTVVQFFVNNPQMELRHVNPIVDYLNNQCQATVPYSMKGRTVASILRQVEAWHRTLRQFVVRKQNQYFEWNPSGIVPFEFTEGDEEQCLKKTWSIVERLNSRELFHEGQVMKHCVASYAGDCAVGHTSIWSLQMRMSGGLTNVLTLQIRNQTRQIVQIRGRCNNLPSEKPLAIVKRWANQAGLSIQTSSYS